MTLRPPSSGTALLGLALLALAACNPFENLPDDGYYSQPLAAWDPAGVALDDGLYVMLPASAGLARLEPSGDWERIELNGATPGRLVAAPDGETLLVFGSYPFCDTDEPRVETVQDCEDEGDDLVTVHELQLVRGGAVVGALELEAHFNALAFTSDGSTAVAYPDFSSGVNFEIEGLANPTQVQFIDLDSGTATAVPVGFSADRILFDEADTIAVVLSRSQVVVVELLSGDYNAVVTFPLSLDVDDHVRPEDVALTPDGRYALITIQGSGELYVLDLELESINIVDLATAPTDMVVDLDADRTALVYGNQSRVDILEHDYFDIETIDLEEPATNIVTSQGFALLYNTASDAYHDVYRIDLLTGELVEYRSENPLNSLQLDLSENYAVGVARPEGGFADNLDGYYNANWGIQILDMGSDDGIALVAEAQPVGLAFSEPAGLSTALVLLDGVNKLLQVDLSTGTAEAVEMEDTPLGIGALGDDLFYITHDAALGLVSFLDPQTNEITPVSGFATAGLMPSDTTLPRQSGEN